jgi:hypothetical protein
MKFKLECIQRNGADGCCDDVQHSMNVLREEFCDNIRWNMFHAGLDNQPQFYSILRIG